jgi:RimJ/RimL family protein N-acetyltransferase
MNALTPGAAPTVAADPPIGPDVATHPAARPERIILEGRLVRLEPLDPSRHGDALWRDIGASGHDGLWRYLFEGPFAEEAAFRAYLERHAASADSLFFAVVDRASGQALGFQSLMRIEPAHRVIEVGNILSGPSLQRSVGATEAQYLFARYVFDALGYRRYEWKCNALNAPSRRAAERLGFTFEGVFRQHMIVKGHNRDTAWFSMVDGEWPARKAAFEAWLDPANFDRQGSQKRPLAAWRRPTP